MSSTLTRRRDVRDIPPWVLAKAREQREWARKAGPVIVVHATRCECGGWMRPGVDHVCDRPAWRHTVQHITGRPATCTCGWSTPDPIPVPWVELIARRHLVSSS